jgi:cell division inhibitor SepF
MNSGLLSKLKNWVSGDPFEEDVYGAEEEFDYRTSGGHAEAQAVELSDESKKVRKSLRVVDHPTSQKTQVVVLEPRAFEEALEIIEHLRTKKSVILNLHLLDTAQSQRVVDFLSGATHAIDGNQQRIGDGVFIFTPNNVSIRSEAEKTMALEDAYWKQSY